MQPDSIKRLIVFITGAVFVAAQPLLARYGLPTPDDAQLGIFAALVMGFIAQSAAKSISASKTAGTIAAAAVTTTAQADAAIAAAIAAQKTLMLVDNDVTPTHGNVRP